MVPRETVSYTTHNVYMLPKDQDIMREETRRLVADIQQMVDDVNLTIDAGENRGDIKKIIERTLTPPKLQGSDMSEEEKQAVESLTPSQARRLLAGNQLWMSSLATTLTRPGDIRDMPDVISDIKKARDMLKSVIDELKLG